MVDDEEPEEEDVEEDLYAWAAEAWRQASVTARPRTREEMATIWNTMRWAWWGRGG